MVRDAIDAGHRLIKTIRVFVSSTGDVQKERILAERLIRSIAAEFNLPVSASESNFQRLAEENSESKTEPENQGTLVLCPYFLEYQKFQLDARLPGTDPEHRGICSGDLYPLVAPRRPDEPDLKDAGWQPARLGNRIRNCLGVGPRKQE